MAKRIITQEHKHSKKLNYYLQGLKGLYEEQLERMVYFCYENFNASYNDVGRALDQTAESIRQKYPKNKEKKS